ncbi:MAG TPA: SDR family oxidoreductase [Candidatus Udaeobacter sp.]|nr:SDR family oxidoreductase [Candidatus Udaeobacter sp.]
MLGNLDTSVLVTGATGFIGRHVVGRLLLAGRRVVVLARGRTGMSAQQRVATIFGDVSKRLEIVEGDLACPSGIRNRLRRLQSKVGTVIHCASEVHFYQEKQPSTRIVQIDGPLALLRMLRDRGLRSWAFVSTAFVCGRRSGVIYENENHMVHRFHNSYECLKLESELRLKQACLQLGIDFRIFRPSIVIGAAPLTAGGMPSNLFFAFLRLLLVLARAAEAKPIHLRIQGRPYARFNIVPVEYVATAIERLIDDPDASGGIFHLVVSNPPGQKALLDMMCGRLGLYGPRILDTREELRDPSALELRLAKMMLPYRNYLEQDVQFDDSRARGLLDRHGIEAPKIDNRQVDRLIELARRNAGKPTNLSKELAVDLTAGMEN